MGFSRLQACGAVVFGLAAFGIATPAWAQSTFQWIPNLPDCPTGSVIEISRDGTTVLGSCVTTGGTTKYFLWRADTGSVELALGPVDTPYAINADGTVVVGTHGFEAFRWTAASGVVLLGDIPGGLARSWAYDVSPDGNTVYGKGTSALGEVGVKWTVGSGPTDLGFPAASSVTVASPDGSILAGHYIEGFSIGEMFRAGGAFSLLGIPEGFGGSRVFDMSDDGSKIVGGALNFFSGSPAMWTPESGVVLLDTSEGAVLAISPDGELMGGSVRMEGENRGIVWTEGGSPISAFGFLFCRVPFNGHEELESVVDIAVTESTVVMGGNGLPEEGLPRAGWVATYPRLPLHVECRRGNVGFRRFSCIDVLFVNGFTGSDPERVVAITPTTPLTVRMEKHAASGDRYALYMWPGQPTADTVRVLPLGTGTSGMPMPMTPGSPQPKRIANNIGRFGVLGVDSWPGSAPLAPATLLDLPGGLGKTGTFYLQGLLLDESAPNGIVGVTNGIVLVSQP